MEKGKNKIFDSQASQTYSQSDIYEKFFDVFGKEKVINYRNKWNASKKYEYCPDFPLELIFELCYACNLKCKTCEIGYSPKTELKGHSISFDLYKSIIDQADDHELFCVHLNSMNEPLLTKNLEEFISYARDKGVIDIAITTNANLLTKERGEALIKAGLTRIQISIDALSSDVYDSVRPGGDYEAVLQNTLDFIETRNRYGSLPIIRVSFLEREENKHQLENFKNFWKDKVDFYTIQRCSEPWTEEELRSKKPWLFEGAPIEYCCGQPNQYMIIRADGSTVACDSLHGHKRKLQNIKEYKVYDIWNSPFWKSLRQTHQRKEYYKDPICDVCIRDSRFFEKEELKELKV